MMSLTEQKEDALINALTVGMTLSDAYVYAGLTPSEIECITECEEVMAKLTQVQRQLEFKLLQRMDDISQKQQKMGKEQATTWLLEKLYPRYSNKPQDEAQTININLSATDPATLDTVTVEGIDDDN